MKTLVYPKIALRYLKITNFKAIDSLEIEFPAPRMAGDPDVCIMGSKNGLGKTSVLEACTLLLLAPILEKENFTLSQHREIPIDLYDLLIRAGAEKTTIEGKFEIGIENKESIINLSFTRQRKFKINYSGDFKEIQKQFHPSERDERFLSSLIGLSSEPIFSPPLLYFHSYRKVQEGNPELGMMVEGRKYYRGLRVPYNRFGGESPISTFKLEILRSMMSRANLFENFEGSEVEANNVLNKLNVMIKKYAGGTIKKLRPSPDNTVDFRINPIGEGESFTFDGLSSGQKEIISTLFLIWRYSKTMQGIVLIDEPELHLNVEWHHDFVKLVHELAPHNQYIFATHSEDIFSSVPEDRRLLLEVN